MEVYSQHHNIYTYFDRLMLGEAFMEVSEDYATEYCEKKQEVLQAKVEELANEKDAIATRQQVRLR